MENVKNKGLDPKKSYKIVERNGRYYYEEIVEKMDPLLLCCDIGTIMSILLSGFMIYMIWA